MKVAISILPLAAAVTAFVIPEEQVFAQIPLENTEKRTFWDKLPSLGKWTGRGDKRPGRRHHAVSSISMMDRAIAKAEPHCEHDKDQSPFDISAWIEQDLQKFRSKEGPDAPPPPHRPPPNHPPPPHPPHDGPPPHHRPPPPPGHHRPPPPPGGKRPGKPGHKKPGHKKPWWKWPPHHRHKHAKPNHTIYELLSNSKYTTNLTKFIDDNKDIRDMLNSTKANYTIFAPTNGAFKRLEGHIDHIPKELIAKALLYHILPDVYPTFRLIWAHTAPTLLDSPALGDHPQRVSVKWTGFFGGLRVNLYDKVIVPNIPATNGLIHATAAILAPPPRALGLIKAVPTEFSTLELGLIQTGLIEAINTTGKDTVGGTIFAPTNTAFKKLGPRANSFLFSKFGEKFLKALLQYHIVPDRTLYSTAFYDGKKKSMDKFFAEKAPEKHQCMKSMTKDVHAATYVHLDLPTLLGKPLAIDIIRRGPFVDIKVNAFVSVAVQDILAKDGVIQIVNNILLPPKKPGATSAEDADYWNGEDEIDPEDLKERLRPFVENDEKSSEQYKLDL